MEACILDLYGDQTAGKFWDLLVDYGEKVLNTLERFAVCLVRIEKLCAQIWSILHVPVTSFLEVRLFANRPIVRTSREPAPHFVRLSFDIVFGRATCQGWNQTLPCYIGPGRRLYSNSISRLGLISGEIIGRPLSIIPAGRLMH